MSNVVSGRMRDSLYQSFLVEKDLLAADISAFPSLIQKHNLIEREQSQILRYRIGIVALALLPIVGWILGYCLNRWGVIPIEERIARFERMRGGRVMSEITDLSPAVERAWLSKETLSRELHARVERTESDLREIRSDISQIISSENRKATLYLVSMFVLAYLPILGWIACYYLRNLRLQAIEKSHDLSGSVTFSFFSPNRKFGYTVALDTHYLNPSIRTALQKILEKFYQDYRFAPQLDLDPFRPLPCMSLEFIKSERQRVADLFHSEMEKLQKSILDSQELSKQNLHLLNGVFTQVIEVQDKRYLLTIQKGVAPLAIRSRVTQRGIEFFNKLDFADLVYEYSMGRTTAEEPWQLKSRELIDSSDVHLLSTDKSFEFFRPLNPDQNQARIDALHKPDPSAKPCNIKTPFRKLCGYVKITPLSEGRSVIQATAGSGRLTMLSESV